MLGEPVGATAFLWTFVPAYAFFIWLGIGGIAYAIMHRKNEVHLVSGANAAWALLLWPLAAVGILIGIMATCAGVRRRDWIVPACSVIANTLAFLCFCWALVESIEPAL